MVKDGQSGQDGPQLMLPGEATPSGCGSLQCAESAMRREGEESEVYLARLLREFALDARCKQAKDGRWKVTAKYTKQAPVALFRRTSGRNGHFNTTKNTEDAALVEIGIYAARNARQWEERSSSTEKKRKAADGDGNAAAMSPSAFAGLFKKTAAELPSPAAVLKPHTGWASGAAKRAAQRAAAAVMGEGANRREPQSQVPVLATALAKINPAVVKAALPSEIRGALACVESQAAALAKNNKKRRSLQERAQHSALTTGSAAPGDTPEQSRAKAKALGVRYVADVTVVRTAHGMLELLQLLDLLHMLGGKNRKKIDFQNRNRTTDAKLYVFLVLSCFGLCISI